MAWAPGATNIVSVSWPDHLSFGEGDGRLLTGTAVARRLAVWRDDLGAQTVYWRLLRTRVPSDFHAAPGYEHATLRAARAIDWDDLAEMPRLARGAGLRAYLYTTVFDEGWPLAPESERGLSFHNAMHGQHVAWQSHLVRDHPQFQVIDRRGRPQHGVVCLAYAQVRRCLIDRFLGLLERGDWHGFFLCLRSQSRPAEHGDQFGYNVAVARQFERQTGEPLSRALRGQVAGSDAAPLVAWRRILGKALTTFVGELSGELRSRGYRFAVGAARGDVLGPPLGNTALDWRGWVRDGLVDELVIGQNSSRCPSMWHELWPMHRGGGYVQNYLDGSGMRPLEHQLESQYGPCLEGSSTRLFVARQWEPRELAKEVDLLSRSAVAGLVFSSFRHDNPGPVARGDWRG